jgi:hypothetical protein
LSLKVRWLEPNPGVNTSEPGQQPQPAANLFKTTKAFYATLNVISLFAVW